MSKTITSPYRYDFVGSFLRPENLKQARKTIAMESSAKNSLPLLKMKKSESL